MEFILMGIKERKEREKERRRHQIMVAAKRVFSAKGFSKTTIEDIAREAELSPGTLYLYFKNKDDLYASLSLGILQYLLIRLEHLNSEKKMNPGQKFELLKNIMYDVYEFDPLILINMFHLHSSENLKNLSPQLIAKIRKLLHKTLKAIAIIFSEGMDKKFFIKKNPSTFAGLTWAMFGGIVLFNESKRIIDNEKNQLKQSLENGFEVLGRGIKDDMI
ncbi:MAG TPA: TetR/AcrR family transcriptional regulator [Desulfobacterales bacterium]|nr:TetR/AcrR family transcriptional regulator [Desulfobacterales bacterium]